ncbi:uncharacterized protein EDB91DRAFT_1165746 [Suillus paluster]|uniref:uncharacterized protein n=1 Tax=Suillus paluster TaxID=48578 RepID=UPI001B86893F|nr:uncharacterized protein EDB91DRAFT_1165746 [Suillus paluster]KAG1726693.1 hypothetical protein EDB91DRAFT_1165746 [Suillus paluster]
MKSATKSATSRCLLLLVVASCFLLSVAHAPHQQLERRQQTISPPVVVTTTAPTTTQTTPTPTTTPQTTSTTPTTTSTTPTTTTPAQTTTTPTTTTSQQQNPPTTTSNTAPTQTTAAPLPVTTSEQVTTNSAGQVITSFVQVTVTSSSATPSSTQSSSSSSSSSGLGTGSIVGLSVAGGVAVIGIVSFFVWKFTRKRFADFDDNEAIKWPELNTHGGSDVHALPTKSTGRSGFGVENDSEVNLARAPSPGGYAHSVAANSLPDTYNGSQDPYAVPPLPHLNPNQPYHDEPGAFTQPGYYDPYRGPVPNTFGDGFSDSHNPEAIPMTRMARTGSPGPQMAYGPQAAMGYALDGRSASPALGAGRASPGPQAGYGYGPR